jgi:CDP-4-dehydro-6-deoxyglucose reductase
LTTPTIRLEPSGQQFAAEPGQTILEAALAAGLNLPYGCRDGVCGACKGFILAGAVDHGKSRPDTLTESERAIGKALFCCALPLGDVVVESRAAAGVADIPVRKLPARIQRLERAAEDVMVMTLKLPANDRFVFLPGQFVDLLLPQGKRRSYSIASSPSREGEIELHVRRMDGGLFSAMAFDTLKERDILRFEGPLGTTFLREDTDRPILMAGGGTGFAPLQAMLERLLEKESPRPVHLYVGARTRGGLYRDELARRFSAASRNIHYAPVLSEATVDCNWTGRAGPVHSAALADLPDLSGYDAYVCGAPAMVDAARRDFAAAGLPEDRFFADAFTTAAN